MAATNQQINDTIDWTSKNNRAARAERFLVQFFWRGQPNDDKKVSIR